MTKTAIRCPSCAGKRGYWRLGERKATPSAAGEYAFNAANVNLPEKNSLIELIRLALLIVRLIAEDHLMPKQTMPDPTAGLPGRPAMDTGDGVRIISPARILRDRNGKPMFFTDHADTNFIIEAASEFLKRDICRGRISLLLRSAVVIEEAFPDKVV
jgi:hypothetical protein